MPARAERSQEKWVIAKPDQGSYWNADLNPGDSLTAKRTDAARGDLLGRDGEALMPLGTVYPVQLDPARATPEVAAQLESLVKAEPGSLVAEAGRRDLVRVEGADPRDHVPRVRLRRATGRPRRPRRSDLPQDRATAGHRP